MSTHKQTVQHQWAWRRSILISSYGHIKRACYELGEIYDATDFQGLMEANDNWARDQGLNIKEYNP
jgi:hypothetical protein